MQRTGPHKRSGSFWFYGFPLRFTTVRIGGTVRRFAFLLSPLKWVILAQDRGGDTEPLRQHINSRARAPRFSKMRSGRMALRFAISRLVSPVSTRMLSMFALSPDAISV